MSPKQCSLAIEDIKEDDCQEDEANFVPELKIFLSKRQISSSIDQQQPVVVRGRMTISF